MAVDFGKVAGRAALSLGAVALGAAAGATAERLVMRLSATPSSDVDLAEFYSLHGDRVEVAASDGAGTGLARLIDSLALGSQSCCHTVSL